MLDKLGMNDRTSICLVGAGLGNCLLAWFITRRHPDIEVFVCESAPRVPRGRTWSFHASDVGDLFEDIADLPTRIWSSYDVYFPKVTRRFYSNYATITPEGLEQKLIQAGVKFAFNTVVRELATKYIVIDSGEKIPFDCVIDGRGFGGTSSRLGYQKFVGQHLRMKKPHGVERPTLMDASVEQADGYRFFYLLPWSPTELLVEDTRYSNNPDLDIPAFEREIDAYVKHRMWTADEVVATESGVLPIPLDKSSTVVGEVPRVGMAGGFFHPVTGYSLADAVRIADRVSKVSSLNPESVTEALSQYRRDVRGRARFYRMLNRMLFLAASDNERRKVFEHFYALPEPAIRRFYAGTSSLGDRFRILSGRPPVPVWAAFRAVISRGGATP